MNVKMFIRAKDLRDNPQASLLVFRTLRTGFPTMDVSVTLEDSGEYNGTPLAEMIDRYANGVRVVQHVTPRCREHWEWAADEVENSDAPFILCDTDMVFLGDVENHLYAIRDQNARLAGEFIPTHRVPESNYVTMERLHTALMLIDPAYWQLFAQSREDELPRTASQSALQWLFYPALYKHQRQTLLYDTSAWAYHYAPSVPFHENLLDRFEHLGGATYKSVTPGFAADAEFFDAVYEDPSIARGLRSKQRNYRWRNGVNL